MRTLLLNHNKAAYQKVVKAFETANRTCVVHPTGTGKSYLIAAVSENICARSGTRRDSMARSWRRVYDLSDVIVHERYTDGL